MTGTMKSLLKEPLLHFLTIGAAFFALYLYLNPGEMSADDRIVVSPERIEQLAGNFRQTWQRPPTRDELDALVNDFVVEEILYRQALAMGIDKNDTVIRRRLRQKMEFYTDDVADRVSPDRERLAQYLADNTERYRQPARVSLEQVYLRNDMPREQLDQRIDEVTAQLAADEAVESDSAMIPRHFESVSGRELDRTFGGGFTRSLADLPVGDWQGPVTSGLGVHFVRIRDFQPARTPALEDVMAEVERDWRNEHTQTLRRQVHERLREDYDVVIRWPEDREPSS